jgi:RNase adapter protein RapZ
VTGRTVTILTGQSGSGKSTALRALEDHGALCVDNLPPGLLAPLVESLRRYPEVKHIALGIDVRAPDLGEVPKRLAELRALGEDVRVAFFEAQEESLQRRFSETRRPHPLDRGQGLRAAMEEERTLLAPLRALADHTVDTTSNSPHELRVRVLQDLVGVRMKDQLRVSLMSFGFKFGLPLEADLVFDVRFLPNPYFVDGLRERDGLDDAVRDYVVDSPSGHEFLERTAAYISYLLPEFQREGKRYLTFAVGCTGGRHRSVSMVRALAEILGREGFVVDVRHRDVAEGRT